jgi:surface antigen
MYKKFAVLALTATTLAACQPYGGGPKESVGTAIGAIAGGALSANIGKGSGQTAAIIAGTMLGSFLGRSVGESLDRADLMYHRQAQNSAYSAPMKTEIQWNNPESGHAGSVTPLREGATSSGLYCREFQQKVTIGGKTEKAYGTACQQPDGNWQING